jgi:hypothetical protein
MSESKKGMIFSPETRLKLSKATLAYWERRKYNESTVNNNLVVNNNLTAMIDNKLTTNTQ